MRKLILLLIVIPFLISAQAQDSKYELNTKESRLVWHGKNVIGAGGHDGTLKVSTGYLQLAGTAINAGEFTIDMTSLKSTDQRDKKNRNELDEHLKNDDFFSVTKFPKAYFVLTKTVNVSTAALHDRYLVTGTLTIKGISNTIEFPATITFVGKTVRAKGEVVFDRTKWNVTFKSQTVFSQIKEGALADDVRIEVDLFFKG